MTINKFASVSTLVLATFLASGAYAADLGSTKDGPSIFGETKSPALWTGFYVGAHGGWADGSWEGTPTWDPGNGPVVGLFDAGELDADGWLAGVTVGANKQIGSLVFGIEADGSWGDFGGEATFTTKSKGTAWDVEQEVDNLGTLRGRIGYAFGPVLVYGTGGVAFAQTSATEATFDLDSKGNRTVQMASASAEENHIGWVAGAGAEWAIGRGLSVKAEWLHVDLGEADYRFKGTNFNTNPDSAHTTDSFSSSLEMDIFRAGINYRF